MESTELLESKESKGSQKGAKLTHNTATLTLTMSIQNDGGALQELFVSPSQMLRRGLKLIGVLAEVQDRRCRATNIRIFKSHFGPHPSQCSTIWKRLLTTDIADAKVEPEEVDLKAFFMALNHVRVYLTDDQRNPTFDNMDFQKMADDTWMWVSKIAALRNEVIKMPPEDSWGDTVCILSIDGTHMMINEPRHPEYRVDPTYYSFKHGTAGFNVQVVLKIREPECVNIHVAKGGQNDMGNLHSSKLLERIPDGKRIIVDGGYEVREESLDKLSGYNQFDSDLVKAFKARVKSRHETYNSKLKVYEVLNKTFRHGIEKFPTYIHCVTVLVQFAITDPDPTSVDVLFDV